MFDVACPVAPSNSGLLQSAVSHIVAADIALSIASRDRPGELPAETLGKIADRAAVLISHQSGRNNL